MEGNRRSGMSFEEAERRFGELRRRFEAGAISEEEFDEQRKRLMVRDGTGRWWAKSRQTGEWRYRAESGWEQGTPPSTSNGGGRRIGLLIGGGLSALVVVLLVVGGVALFSTCCAPPPDSSGSSSDSSPSSSSDSSSSSSSDSSSSSSGSDGEEQTMMVVDPASTSTAIPNSMTATETRTRRFVSATLDGAAKRHRPRLSGRWPRPTNRGYK